MNGSMPSCFIEEGKFIGSLLECWFAERDLLHRVRYIFTSGDVLGAFTVCDYNAIHNLNFFLLAGFSFLSCEVS